MEKQGIIDEVPVFNGSEGSEKKTDRYQEPVYNGSISDIERELASIEIPIFNGGS